METQRLGAFIRQERLEYGMTQKTLAKRVGITTTAMNDLEQGRTRDPRFSVVQRIAQSLGLSLQRFAHVVIEGRDAVPQRRVPTDYQPRYAREDEGDYALRRRR
jgi:transcriptional regulator with XRE-family HTH domain